MMKWYGDWRVRHQHPVSFLLHMIGIPMTVAAGVLVVTQLMDDRWDLWWRPVSLLAGGYLLQWLGHRIEGNTMGEIILWRKWRGRPYTAVSPRYRKPNSGERLSPF